MQARSEGATAAAVDARFAAPRQPLVAARPRLSAALAASVADHRVTLVAAPSGMGKTVAVAEWAVALPLPVAWLSLTRHDADALRLSTAVVQALRRAAVVAGHAARDDLLAIDPGSRDADALYRAVVEALAPCDEPLVLVVDDLHRAGACAETSIVGSLIEQAPGSLRLVLVGREPHQVALDRLVVSGDAQVIGADALRMTPRETAAAAALFNQALTEAQSEQLTEAVDGWAAAVRLALVSGAASGASVPELRRGDIPRLTEFIADEVLGPLPTELRAFVLDATTVAVLDARLAEAITGRSDAVGLLEECVSRGLFLDRFGEPGADASYRWHSAFASRCRALRQRDDPQGARRLHRLAAAALAVTDPLRSIDQSLAGDDPESAVQTLRDCWVALLLGANGESLGRVCAALPAPWSSSADVLIIQACAMDVGGSRAEGQRMLRHARTLIPDLRQPTRARAERLAELASLMLTDDYGELASVTRRVRARLDERPPGSPLAHAADLLLLGSTQLHLRIDADATIESLSAAETWALEAQEPALRARAVGLLAFVQAFRGDFDEALETLSRVDIDRSDVDRWRYYLGGAADAAAAWVAFWRGDAAEARTRFRRVVDSGAGPTSFAGIARHYLAFVAAEHGDARERAEAAELLSGIPSTESRGMPWPAYRMVSQAALALAEGRADRAAAIARRFGSITNIPAAGAILAELVRKAVGDAEAVSLVEQLRLTGRAGYVRASSLVTLALVQRSRRNTREAHALLERALRVAEPQRIGRPFADDAPELRALLREHVAWGTAHAAFLAAVSTPTHAAGTLSVREQEVLRYLRTDLRIGEIAGELGVSINTVKTHTRTIYRKLGVSNRRDAVRSAG